MYSYFRDNSVWMPSAIKVDSSSSKVSFENSYTRFLSGSGGIDHVVNDQGDQVGGGRYDSYLCDYGSSNELIAESDSLEQWELTLEEQLRQ